jgi:DNA-binding FrmR family transcriptional regulator
MELNQLPEIMQRLRSAAGQLNAIVEMAESGQPCEQVLHQLHAVQSALRIVSTKIICCEAESIRNEIVNSASVSYRLAELQRLQSLYSIHVQHFNHTPEVNYD